MDKITQYISPRYIGAVTRLIIFLTAVAPVNGAVDTLLNQLNSGDKVLKEGHHYFRKRIASNSEPASIVDIIKGTDAKAVGEMSFDKAALAQGEIFCVSHIGLSYAKNTGGANLFAQDLLYSNSVFNARAYENGTVDSNSTETGNQFFPVESQLIPNKFLSAEVRFKFGNERWLEGQFKDFCKYHKVNTSEGLGAFDTGIVKELGLPKILDNTKMMGFEIEFGANSTAVGAADYYIGIDYYGIKVVDKA
jgi:hypothetical protein